MRFPPLALLVLSAIVLCGGHHPANARTVALHQGSVDPQLQGWTEFDGASTGQPDNDAGAPVWSIEDTSLNGGQSLQYQVTPSPQALLDASSNGWSLKTRLRVVDNGDAPDFNISVGWSNQDGTRFEMLFGSDVDGDPIVVLHPFDGAPQGTGPFRFVLEGVGPGFHDYELRTAAGDGSADLLVDGVVVLEDYPGFLSNTQPFVAWGDRTSTATLGHGHYNFVAFEIAEAAEVPSLSRLGTVALASLLAMGLACYLIRAVHFGAA